MRSLSLPLASQAMKLGFYMGYAQPGTNPLELLELAREAERLGYDSAWAAEAWGVDAITPLAWLGAQTTTIKLGTAIMQIPGRSPANAAMTAVTLDLLSGGRFLMGLGTSGPQVVEGWHGQEWGKPLGKTREYVEIVRDDPAPRAARASRRALRHPGAGRHGARQAAEADGAPAARRDPDLPRGDRAEGGRAGVRDRRRLAADLLVAGAGAQRVPARPRARGIRHRAVRAGDRHRRRRVGPRHAQASTTRSTSAAWARAARTSTTISSRATATRRRRARSRISSSTASSARRRRRCPDAFVDEVALVGSVERIRDRLAAWRESGATTLLVSTRDRRRCAALPKPPLRTDRVARAVSASSGTADLEDRRARVLRAELAAA